VMSDKRAAVQNDVSSNVRRRAHDDSRPDNATFTECSGR
jgi:hypothetical protein